MGGRWIVAAACAAVLGAGCAVVAPSTGTPSPATAPLAASPSAAPDVGPPQPGPSAAPTSSGPTGRAAPAASTAKTSAARTPQAPATPTEIRGVVLVNRTHPVAADYVPAWADAPDGLAPDMRAALDALFADAAARGLTLRVRSGYRSYAEQSKLYTDAVADYGKRKADLYFAVPGTSEHQTGLAADLTDAAGHRGDAFLSTPEAAYLAEHAMEFGLIIRYPKGRTAVTGYEWEPWHVRYVGKKVAAAFVGKPALTLEEYLGVD